MWCLLNIYKLSNNHLFWKLHHCQRGETITCTSTILERLNSLPERAFLRYYTSVLRRHGLLVPGYFYHMNLQRLPPLTCSSFIKEGRDTASPIIKYPCQLFITALGIQRQDEGFRFALVQVYFYPLSSSTAVKKKMTLRTLHRLQYNRNK